MPKPSKSKTAKKGKKAKRTTFKKKGHHKGPVTGIPSVMRLGDFAVQNIREYGTYVLEQRAIPDFRDGMKPVNRRILFAMYVERTHSDKAYMKSARTIGNVIGKYHPHGTVGSYGAMVNMAQALTVYNTVDGQGNWGSILGDNAAADRYTEARLSKLADDLIINREYMAVAEMVPNFDGLLTEPLYLPSLIPYVLLSGISGIAVGTTTNIPPFEMSGVMKLVKKALLGKKVTPKNCLANLEFAYPGNPVCVSDDDTLLEYYKTGKSTGTDTIKFSCSYTIDKKNPRKFFIDCFTPAFKPDAARSKILKATDLPVYSVTDESDAKGNKIAVTLKPSASVKLTEEVAETVCDLLTTSQAFRTNIETRGVIKTADKKSGRITYKDDHSFESVSIPELIVKWTDYRIELEKKLMRHLITQVTEKIAYINLMRFAISRMEIIFAVLKSKVPNLNEALAKKLKIPVEDAKTILDRQIRSLSNLSDTDLKKQLNDAKLIKVGYKARLKDPQSSIIKSIAKINYDRYD